MTDFERRYDMARARGQWDEARHWLQQGATAADAFACGQLGVWHLLGHHVNRDDRAGFRLVRRAARAGLPEARRLLATLYASGRGVEANWDQAVDGLIRAARAGDIDPTRQLAFLLPARLGSERRALLEQAAKGQDRIALSRLEHDEPIKAAARIDWRRVRQGAVAPALSRGGADILHEAPRLQARKAALTAELCGYLMGIGAPFMSRARVNDPTGGKEVIDDSRSNSFANLWLLEGDVVTAGIDAMLARLVGQPAANAEPASVLHYAPGQEFAPHFDFFEPEAPVHAAELASAGQRVVTCLVYLNTDYEGGATRFMEAAFEFRGETGTALFWRNVDDAGEPDRLTRHAGLPPDRGEKWLLSKWFRDRPQTRVRPPTV